MRHSDAGRRRRRWFAIMVPAVPPPRISKCLLMVVERLSLPNCYMSVCVYASFNSPPILSSMSHHLESDERGIILPCPACGTANRIAYAKVSQQGRCGTCKADLPLVAAPVEMTSPAAFAALISQSPQPVVIDFWAAWCGPCQMMAPEFAKAAAQAAGEALFIKVNTDEQQQIASQFRIQGIPAFALMKNGKVTAQTSGFQPAARLRAWMRQS
ncbi:MAG TPA: thioredoxin [Verrucomicrobiales bacterium]|nr:thioredoxin [Verrucomicrobiales bacterium]